MRVVKAPEFRQRHGYTAGLSCIEASGSIFDPMIARCEVMTLLAVDAVLESRRRNPGKRLTILELGSGTGILTIAALLADPNATAIAVESCSSSVAMMRDALNDYGLSKHVEIINTNYAALKLDRKVDVVISENMNVLFHNEDQFESMLIAKRCAHEKTVFAPAGFDIFLGEKEQAVHIGKITADSITEADTIFSHSLSPGMRLPLLVCPEMLNYNHDRIFCEASRSPFRGIAIAGEVMPEQPVLLNSREQGCLLEATFPTSLRRGKPSFRLLRMPQVESSVNL